MRVLSIVLLALWIFSWEYSAQPARAQTASDKVLISEIKVSGNLRVAEGTILSYLPLTLKCREPLI